MGAIPKCTGSDPNTCHSFQQLQAQYNDTTTCKLATQGQGEIEVQITGRRPLGSTEENCEWMLIAGKGNKPMQDIRFSLDTVNPDFNKDKGFIEVPNDTIDPSNQGVPVSRKFLVQYVGTTQTRITVHCKFWHGDSIDKCEMCTHYISIILSVG